MMGRSHALSGAAVWLAAAPPVSAAVDIPLEPASLAAGAVLTSGSALLPDLDTSKSTIARALGPVTLALAFVVATVAGGHRAATHSLAFVAAVAAATTAAATTTVGTVAIVALCVGLALRALGPQQLRSGLVDATFLAWTAAATWAIWAAAAPLGWLPVAVAAGALAGVLGDWVTSHGVPLLWPWSQRFAVPLVRTGGLGEHVVSLGLVAVTGWLGYHHLLAPAVG